MSDDDPKPPSLAISGNEVAPFIYFDAAPTYGHLGGAIQIELAARIITLVEDDKVTFPFVVTAHLRCSPIAAAMLKDSIEKALALLQQPQESEAPTGGARLN